MLIAHLSFAPGCGDSSSVKSDPILSVVAPSHALAKQWFLNNIRDKGLFRYVYDVETNSYSHRNNELRQLMASRLLAEMAATDTELIPEHKKNLVFVFKYWYRERSGLGYIQYNSKSKLGANAMALRTLVASPLFDQYSSHANSLFAGILHLLDDDGSFTPWFQPPTYSYDPEYLLYFFSGEAILSLAEYYQRSGNPLALQAAKKAQEYYIDRYVKQIDVNFYPAYVPWHTQSLSLLFKITGDGRYAQAALLLNDRLLEIQDTSNYVGRFYNPLTPQYGTPHSASDGVYIESLAYALEIAQCLNDAPRVQLYRNAIMLAAENLRSLQYHPGSENEFGVPNERLVGGIRISPDRPNIRIDNVQHCIDACRKIADVLTQGHEMTN